MPTSGRNDPCPCGSGKKYKQCCLGQAEPATTEAGRLAHVRNATERAVFERAMHWADRRLGGGWPNRAIAGIAESEPPGEAEFQFLLPWLVYHYPLDGVPPAEQFFTELGSRLSDAERQTLTCHQKSYVSIWEVRSVEPGVGVELFDLLTHATRFVHDVRGTRTLQRWGVVLASVVEYPEVSVFASLHPRMLLPADAARVLSALRRALRVRTRAVSLDRLRAPEAQLALVRAWRDVVRDGDLRAMRPRVVSNTDGDPLALCTDRFDLPVAKRDELLAALCGIDGAARNETDEGLEIVFSRPGNKMHKSWDNTIIGRAVFNGARLLVETNSVARADALRRRIERAAGTLLRHRRRDVRDIEGLLRKPAPAPRSRKAEGQPSPEVQAMMRQVIARHYDDWLDDRIPALGGRTPRQAAASEGLRPRLISLLKELEILESAKPEHERFDVDRLWRALDIDPLAAREVAEATRVGGAEGKRPPLSRRQSADAKGPALGRRGPRRDTSILELKLVLRDVEPPVWRRVRVRSHITLAKLHEVLQRVMGWTDSHLHEFEVGGETFGVPDLEFPERKNEKQAVVGEMLDRPGARLVYEYDFGDGWEHDVVLEQVLAPDPEGPYPAVLDGARACPPEDCGGAHGYAELLRVLAHTADPEHAHMVSWVGGSFDPEAFDRDELNRSFHGGWYLPKPDDAPRSKTALPRRTTLKLEAGKHRQ